LIRCGCQSVSVLVKKRRNYFSSCLKLNKTKLPDPLRLLLRLPDFDRFPDFDLLRDLDLLPDFDLLRFLDLLRDLDLLLRLPERDLDFERPKEKN
jgi:hypothetical protein